MKQMLNGYKRYRLPKGKIYGWKVVRYPVNPIGYDLTKYKYKFCLARVLIPEDAIAFKPDYEIVENKDKCRATHGKILYFLKIRGKKKFHPPTRVYSAYWGWTEYWQGGTFTAHFFSWKNVACASGFHFYRTKKAAIDFMKKTLNS